MIVKITGHTSPISIAAMWYANRIGEVFEVDYDEKFKGYLTKEPIYKHHRGHIYKVDCVVVNAEGPQSTE